MPLEAGKTREAFSHNVSEMVKAGHPQKQAVAAAYSEQRRGDSESCGSAKMDACMARFDRLDARMCSIEDSAACDRVEGRKDAGGWRSQFKDPGGNSALRAANSRNPRNLPCPSCGQPNRLTPADKARGYQCDECANRDEGGGW